MRGHFSTYPIHEYVVRSRNPHGSGYDPAILDIMIKVPALPTDLDENAVDGVKHRRRQLETIGSDWDQRQEGSIGAGQVSEWE